MKVAGSRIFVTGGSGFIGTNLVELFSSMGATLLNFDINGPLDNRQKSLWVRGDIMNAGDLKGAMTTFCPDIVIHLAARTDCDENATVEKGYAVNVEGTANVLKAAAGTPSVRHLIAASTQYVCRPGYLPANDEDFSPHTVYGESKARMEKLVRGYGLRMPWTIIRPANIWGPWHMRYRREVWRVISRGLYLHPGRKPVIRTYGYVKNVVEQIARIIESDVSKIAGRVFYLGDPPDDIYKWVNAFSLSLRGRPAPVVPRTVVRMIAMLGDILCAFGLSFPLTSSRYRSMTQDYVVPTDRTLAVFGPCPYSLDEGVSQTVRWLRTWK